jgi:Flp pilus assembly protein TadD
LYKRFQRGADARREFGECERLAGEDLKVNARSPDSHGILAVCQAKLGRFDRAVAAANEAIALAPGSSDGYHRLAAVLALAGRPPEAVAALAKGFAAGLAPALVTRDDDLASLRERADYQELLSKKR